MIPGAIFVKSLFIAPIDFVSTRSREQLEI